MRTIEVIAAGEGFRPGRDRHAAPSGRAAGSIDSRLASPPEASVWLATATLDPGASLEWDAGAEHADEGLYVSAGELEIERGDETGVSRCPRGGAVVIEAGAGLRVRARSAVSLVHVGPRDRVRPDDGPYGPAESRRAVHVIGPRGIFEATGDGRETRFFADATCPGCRLWLLYTARHFAFESPTHSHSQDELIHLLWGEITLGARTLGPGTTLFIAADQPYGFRSGPQGFGFLNYRRDASWMTTRGRAERQLEAGAATGLTPVRDSFAPG